MSAIARFVMQGPLQASFAAVIFVVLPLPILTWVSGAIVSLVVLRQGLAKGMNVVLAALLPGVIWYAVQQDIIIFSVVLGAALMAFVLRQTVSLPKSIFVSLLLGMLVITLFPHVAPDYYGQLQEFGKPLQEAIEKQLPEAATETAQNQKSRVAELMPSLLLGAVGVMVQVMLIASLLLARSWQATLYNPGGFRQEFHALRMPIWFSAVVIGAELLGSVNPDFVKYVPVFELPLVLAGIALVHAMVALKQLSSQWLVAFYIGLILFMQIMYPLLILIAVADSFLNIRMRLKDTANK